MVKEELVMAGEGMFCKHVRNLELHHVRVETRQGPAIRMERVEGAALYNVTIRNKHADPDVIAVKDTVLAERGRA